MQFKQKKAETPVDDIDPADELPEDEYDEAYDSPELGLFGDGLDGPYNVPMEKHSDLLKGMTDFSKYLKKIYNNWRGIVWDEKEKKYVIPKDTQPIMSVIGANWCSSFIETYVRDNNVLAHLDNIEYQALIRDINRTLMLSLGTRYKEFGFHCFSDVIRVWNEVENASLLALSGAGAGKYSEFLGGITKYNPHASRDWDMPYPGQPRNVPLNQQRRGFFGTIRNWLGR